MAGIVLEACALDLGAVACRRGIVDAQQQAFRAEQGLDSEYHADGQVVELLADGADEGVVRAEVVFDPNRAEPGGDGAASAGEEDAQQE
jgi:hypothetical protein